MKRPRGIYRTKRPAGMEADAWVEDGGIGMDVSESLYRARRYEPDFDSLPWKETPTNA
jgi:hypothetical protein